MLSKIIGSVVGTKNDRELKRMRKVVSKINAREAEIQALSDEQLQQKTEEFKARHQKGESLDGLLPEGIFKDWIVKTVSIKQINDQKNKSVDGDAAVVFELLCGTQIGSGQFNIDGELKWGATIKYNSRQYREISKLSNGEFAIISGTFQKINDFAPGKKETFYASRPLTNKDLEEIQNSRYGNGDELFLAYIKYIASAN